MKKYSDIIIIYNPNSTGASEKLARAMQTKLQTANPEQKVTLAPTKRAQHATELAYKLAKKSSHPLIISASGDGGYHEVVNGLMRAQAEGAQPVAGLLPAGNANDHFHNLHKGDFVEAVTNGKEHRIDVLKLTATRHGQPFERYAHSYIGMGLTSKVSRELNKTRLKRFKEALIVAKGLWRLKPVHLEIGGEVSEYDSIIFSNVNRMSKVFLLSKETKMDDGKFEVTAILRRDKFKLITAMLKASTTGLGSATQTDSFAFQTVKPTLVQLDGEVTKIDARTTANVTLEPRALHCIV